MCTVLVSLLLASCTAGVPADGPGPTGASPSMPPESTAARVQTKGCPVTRPNGEHPPGDSNSEFFGNGRLWVDLWVDGHAVTSDMRRDGSLAVKFPWTRGVRGELTITGHRLDAPAPPARASVPDGYGSVGFQSSAIIFPTAGCWQVTGKVGQVSLTFVTTVNPR